MQNCQSLPNLITASSTKSNTSSIFKAHVSFSYEVNKFVEYSRISSLEKMSPRALNILKSIHKKDEITEIAKTQVHAIENFLDINLENFVEILGQVGMIIPGHIKDPFKYYYENIIDYIPVIAGESKVERLPELLCNEKTNWEKEFSVFSDLELLSLCLINYNSRKELIRNMVRIFEVGDLFFIPKTHCFSTSFNVAYGKFRDFDCLNMCLLRTIFQRKWGIFSKKYKNPKRDSYFNITQLQQLKILLISFENERGKEIILRL